MADGFFGVWPAPFSDPLEEFFAREVTGVSLVGPYLSSRVDASWAVAP